MIAPLAKQRLRSRWSFAPAIAVALAVAVALVGLSLAFLNESQASADKLRDATVQADILSRSVSAALAFDDNKLAQEYVDALGARPDVKTAGVYGLDGALVAGYAKLGAAAPRRASAAAPAGDDIVVVRPVTESGMPLGTVYLRTMREPFVRRVTRYVGIGLLLVMASLMLIVFGAANASLAEAHRKLRVEMDERAKTEEALRLSREMEAAAQIEITVQRSRAAVRQSAQQLDFALSAGRLGSWAIDLETGALNASNFFWANFGLEPAEAPASVGELDRHIHPDDRERQRRTRQRAIQKRGDLDAEYRTLSPEGGVRWIMVRGQAVHDEDGTVRRLAGVSMDITQRKEAEERQRLLLDELNHRVKNTLATVQSVALQTRRDTNDAMAFEHAFLARLGALARVHDLLSRVSWQGASLADVLMQTLAPHLATSDPTRVGLEGPKVQLGPNAAVTLTMAFHELATNAAKYGALSTERGRIEVVWVADDPQTPSLIDITWRESDGPMVSTPTRRGFGSRLLERGLAREFDGEVSLEFDPTGVVCRMRIPLSQKLRMAA